MSFFRNGSKAQGLESKKTKTEAVAIVMVQEWKHAWTGLGFSFNTTIIDIVDVTETMASVRGRCTSDSAGDSATLHDLVHGWACVCNVS